MTHRYLLALLGLLGCGIAGFAAPVESQTAAPIVDAASGQLYGAASATGWLSAQDAVALVKKDLQFSVYAGDGSLLNKTKLSAVQSSEVCSNPTYRAKGSLPERAVTLVAASWNAAPRRPGELDRGSPVYREALTLWLREQGIDDPQPVLSQLWRVDLEGDGRDEVLMAAARHRGSETSTEAGDYSVLLLRQLAGDNVVTVPIRSDVFRETCIAECALERHEVIGVLDLNGDGRLEIISKSAGYESTTQAVYSVEGDSVTKRLEWFCGA
jgi:hypothetical protein